MAKLKISGYVAGIRFKELLEIVRRGFVVAKLRAFKSEAVARESIGGFFSDKFFQDFAARLLCLGHGLNARIIAGLKMRAKPSAAPGAGEDLLMAKFDKSTNSKADKPAAAAELPGKPVRASKSEMVEAVLPNDANSLGNMLGGRVMHLIDIAGALAAHRHSNSHVVTASVDYLDFRFPISVGEFIVLKSSVNRVFRTSMEVGVKVFSENILTGERKHTSSAYVTFVAIDLNRQPHAVPPLILETEDDRRRFREAGERRRVRLNMRHKRPLSDA